MELFKIDPGRFDCVITDMTMPQMTGDKLAKSILEIRPEIPVIICTGFSSKLSTDTVDEIGVSALLYKPIDGRKMAKTLRDILK